MSNYALTIASEDTGAFRWQLLHLDGERFMPHQHAECEFDSYGAALNAGTLALAAADGEEYENEAADPVGSADCKFVDTPPT